MESMRQQKFGRMVQKELSEVFQREMMHTFGRSFITITTVRMSPDLALAKVYLSLLMADDKEEIMETLEYSKKEIRKRLGIRIGKQVRIIPELIFYFDDTAEYAAKMDKLISGLDIPPARDEEE